MLQSFLSEFRKYVIIAILCFIPFLTYSLQLGDGTNQNRLSPVRIMENVKAVSGGLSHSLIIKTDNTLWAVGSNENGQLGDGTKVDKNIPVQIMKDISQVSAGDHFSMALSKKGELWVFGLLPDSIIKAKNKCLKDRLQFSEYVQAILLDVNVSMIAAGPDYMMYIKNDNTLWGCGNNNTGALGMGHFSPIAKPVMIRKNTKRVFAGQIYSLITDMKDDLYISGNIYPNTLLSINGPISQFTKMASDVTEITEGLYINKKSELWGFGFAAYGNLGLGNSDDIVPQTYVLKGASNVASSGSHTLIRLLDGKLFACGGGPNLFGGLGTGDNRQYITPIAIVSNCAVIAVGRFHSFYIDTNGILWGFGLNSYEGLL